MADFPDPVGPDTTLSLPVGKVTERSISWNGVSATADEVTEAVPCVLAAAEVDSPLATAFLSFLVFLSLSSFDGVSSDCLPVFHCSVACLNPIVRDSEVASGRRFKDDTQSGTAYQLHFLPLRAISAYPRLLSRSPRYA